MILISFVLCVIAIVVLGVGAVAGLLLGLLPSEAALLLIYVAIAIIVVAAVLLAIGTFRARAEIFGGGSAAGRKDGRPAPGNAAAKAKAARAAGKAPDKPGASRPTRTSPGGRTSREVGARTGGAAQRKAAVTSSAPPPEVPGGVTVVVVPGRRRYHLANCRQLVGRSREELTYEEAREEGFTPCTACMPDAALVARASAGEPEDPGSSDEQRPSSDEAATEAEKGSGESASTEPEESASAEERDDGEVESATEEFAAVSDNNRRGS